MLKTSSKIPGTLGKGISLLSVDKDYVLEREQLSREKPKHVGEGFAYGVRDLGLGVFRGLTGVVTDPWKAVQNEGWIALWKGLLGGASGLVGKPIVGAIDLVTKTTEGIRNTATYWDELKRHRIRAPRYFGPDKVLRPYHPKKSEGQEILYHLEDGRYTNEWYVFHIKLGSKTLLLSSRHILYVKGDHEEWNVSVDDIRGLEMWGKGIVIVLSTYASSSLFETPTHRRIVPVPSRYVELVYSRLLHVLGRLKHPSASQIQNKQIDPSRYIA